MVQLSNHEYAKLVAARDAMQSALHHLADVVEAHERVGEDCVPWYVKEGASADVASAVQQARGVLAEHGQGVEPCSGDCRRTAESALAYQPAPSGPRSRYPDLGEDAADRVFHAEHNFRSSYSLWWKVADDVVARAKLRELNVRPGHICRREPGQESHATRLGCDVYVCLVTSAAHKKLRDASVLVSRIVLD